VGLFGVYSSEIPLVKFELMIKGGHWLDPLEKAGVASFVEDGQKELMEMSLDDFHQVIHTYIDESKMLYLVVGDAKSQLKPIGKLGYGSVVQIIGQKK
jgi:hypothetical protein